jgi:putative heme-binding domain-containing protein
LPRHGIDLAQLRDAGDPELQETAKRIAAYLRFSRKTIEDESASEDLRETASHLLGWDPETRMQDLCLVKRLLAKALPLRLHAALLQALGHFPPREAAGALLANWNVLSPSLRAQAIQLLLGREEGISELLGALEDGTIQRCEVPAASRQQLIRHPNTEIQKRSAALLAASGSDGPERSELLHRYASVPRLRPVSEKGSAHFAQYCASCHHFRGTGNAVGPDLAALTDKSSPFLLAAILDPNAAVEDRYVSYSVTCRDGSTLSGIITAETAASISLANAAGALETVVRSEISEIQASNLSLMPEGLEAGLSPQDMADLIAFLQGL